MKIRHVRYWEKLRVSYWFVPGLMALAALGLAAAFTYVDWLALQGRLPGLEHLHLIVADAPGARIVLSTIAGSAITVAGVIFSITIVVLNTAATQFGPRLVRNFMEHAGTQTVLGIYVGTFIYCLVVLSAVRTRDPDPFVPQNAVAAGLFLGVLSCGALIYFIHHVSVFIQAPRIVDNVASRLEHVLRTDYPVRTPGTSEPSPDEEAERVESAPDRLFQGGTRTVCATKAGYLQAIDLDGLLALAVERGLLVTLPHRAGHFVFTGGRLAHASPAERVDGKTAEGMRAAFIVGPDRTPTQDLEYSVRQLVEIALRALSPSINDPFTTANCIDRLGAALVLLGARKLRSRYRRDGKGGVRLVIDPHTYRGVVGAAFDQIRDQACGNAAVSVRLLNVIGEISARELPRPFRHALREQAEAIYGLNRDRLPADSDRDDLERRYRWAMQTLGDNDDGSGLASG